jgi:hypothetical protein
MHDEEQCNKGVDKYIAKTKKDTLHSVSRCNLQRHTG